MRVHTEIEMHGTFADEDSLAELGTQPREDRRKSIVRAIPIAQVSLG